MNYIYIDIETGPANNAGEFEPEFKAPGNLKDPVKIEAAIAEKRAEWLDKLALSAVTGRVLAVGLAIEEGPVTLICEEDEGALLRHLWLVLREVPTAKDYRLCGWNLAGFDLPFLQRRSWIHGIQPPNWIYFSAQRPSYYHADLMKIWAGETLDRISLDTAARLFKLGAKTGSGKDFAELLKTDRDAAMAYLRQDIELTRKVAKAMGVAE